MPEAFVRLAQRHLITALSVLAVSLCAAPALAQNSAQPAVNDRQVQAFFNGIALDQQLAQQYANPAPAPKAAATQKSAAAPAVAPRPKPAVATKPLAKPLDEPLDDPQDEALDDAAALDKLEADLDAAVAGGDDSENATIVDVPPSPAQTALLVLASLALLAFAGMVLTMAVRELKKDANQRKITYRRRVKRRGTSDPVQVS